MQDQTTKRQFTQMGWFLALGFALAILPGCVTVNCPNCGETTESCGAGGCPPPKAVVPGVTKAEGRVCNKGVVCKIENQPNCSLANENAQCKSKNTSGACSCTCE